MEEVRVQPTLQLRQEWTVGDLEATEDEDWRRYQIVDGALVVSPSTVPIHELASEEVRACIRAFSPPGHKVIGPIGIDLGRSYLIPDLAVVPMSVFRRETTLLRPVDVLLTVEVVSPGSVTMDRVLKPAKYAAAGIRTYWRVETDPVSLTAYVLRDGTYAELGTWHQGQVAEIAEPFAVRIDLDALVPPTG